MIQKLLCLACLAVVPLSAQDEPAISLKFSCLEWGGRNTEGLRYSSQGEAVPVRMYDSYRSDVYEYSGANPIVFFVESIDAEGEPVRRPVARARVAPGIGRALFLFVQRPEVNERGEEYEVIVMDESLSSFPAGTYRVFNFSDHEIGGIIGKNKFTIGGKTFETISPKVDDMVDVQIHFSQKINDQWVPKVNTRWLYRENARNIVFVTDDQSSRVPRLRVKTVTEYLNP